MSNIKKIVFIPPNGKMFINDFSIQRLGEYFKSNANIHTTLLKIDTLPSTTTIEYIDCIINVKSEDELFEQLKLLDYDVIFHRSWMLAYPFAATLVKKFDNVIVNIKDWNFSTQKEYKIIFGEKAVDDFKAIDYIFKNAKAILSHYTHEQAKIWAKQYNVNENKFIFFPEFCDEKNFYFRKKINYENPKLVFAGSIGPTSYPEEFSSDKSYVRVMKQLTKKGIHISYVLPEGAYAGTQSPRRRLLFQDILYEDKFNSNFQIKKGETLNSLILADYHFGFFNIEHSLKCRYADKHAIASKFAFYLEAGLPIITNSKIQSLTTLIKTFGLGITISNKDVENLDIILKNITSEEYDKMRQNVEKFRENFTYSRNIHILQKELYCKK